MLNLAQLEKDINNLWEQKDTVNTDSPTEQKNIIYNIIQLIDTGVLRTVTKYKGNWKANQWIKKAVLLYFKINKMDIIKNHPEFPNTQCHWYDKIPLKFENWTKEQFEEKNIRTVPGSIVRKGSYIGNNVIMMPSFVNIGAYIGSGTMVDTWATIGSCAQIGNNCHISGGAGIGGVLEPLQASAVVIEDNVFIGARSEIVEGVIVRENAVISMGVFIGATTKIIDRITGEIYQGEVPSGAVVVPGSLNSDKIMENKKISPNIYCAVIVKYKDEKTEAKVKTTKLLRENSRK